MSDMSRDTEDLRIRKEKLESELQHIQSQLESTLEEIRDDVTARVNPLYWIKRYPLRAAGIAVVAGFMLARSVRGSGGSDSFGGLLASELKRVATQKAVGFVVNTIEKKLDSDK
ncbi:MAG: hypothetical protein EA364_04445 [Balneolaceae bacterium]|nr:MAG: hypothetical protein EA364_04445 [Balneolaceae bacterium]